MIKRIMDDVFAYKKGEKTAILYDTSKEEDADWKFRKKLAKEWASELGAELISYPATGSNNADIPKEVINRISKKDIVIALTRYSATAPLSRAAKKHGFRGASMPGFDERMMSAMELEHDDIIAKVKRIYDLFEESESAEIKFDVSGKEHRLFFDLRGRKPIKDDGVCRKKGEIINLPSGEAFIAPVNTNGMLPIEEEGNVAVYKVRDNQIISSDKNTELMKKIKQDAAVGNIAELAFGVLGLYGIKSSGKVLLDEKLGMHIALGRDDHFGGNTGVSSFKHKKNVWHQDYVYIKETQPSVSIAEAKIGNKVVIKNDKYVIFK